MPRIVRGSLLRMMSGKEHFVWSFDVELPPIKRKLYFRVITPNNLQLRK